MNARSAWFLAAILVLDMGCKGEDTPAEQLAEQLADPLADPWVDAIEADAIEADGETAGAAASSAGDSAASRPAAGDLEPSPAPAELPPAELPPPTALDSAAHAPAVAQPQTPESPPSPQHPPPADGADTHAPPETASPPDTDTRPETTPTDTDVPPSVEPAGGEPAAAPAPAPITLADFHGNYRYVGGQAQRDGLTDAIEDTVNALASALRGIARRRLSAVNPVEGTVAIVVSGNQVSTTFASGFTATAVVGGGTATTKALDGSKLSVQFHAKGNKLVQSMAGKGGARTIVYVLSADRKSLAVHNKITSKRLPVPVTYRLSYTRK